MSRIGKVPIELTDKVNVEIKNNNIKISGPLGNLSFDFSKGVNVTKEENSIVVKPLSKEANAIWGTTRSIINNMIIGVTEGYKKSLEINGVGYKFEVQGKKVILSIGYSHKVDILAPEGIKVELDAKLKNVIHISGIDKQAVGQFASKIKAKKKPEPYKGKGIKYVGEYVRRKAGKVGSK